MLTLVSPVHNGMIGYGQRRPCNDTQSAMAMRAYSCNERPCTASATNVQVSGDGEHGNAVRSPDTPEIDWRSTSTVKATTDSPTMLASNSARSQCIAQHVA